LSQGSGKSFEGDRFSNSDTLGAKATSALTFKAATDFGSTIDARWAKLNMQNFALTIDGSNRGTLAYLDKGYIMNCVITNPGDITGVNNGVLHMSNCTGNPNLKGRFLVGSYVTFSGSVTVIDSMMSSGATPVSIVGAIRNRGVVTGSLSLDITGDATNDAVWNTQGTTNLYTEGANRKIRGIFNAPVTMSRTGTPASGIVQVDSSFTNNKSLVLFSNLNLEVPKGSVFTNNGDMTLYGSLTNKGKIVYRKKITSAGPYSFYAASASIPSGTNLDSLIGEHYANQVMTTFANAVKSRWTFTPKPGSILANATSITLYYSDADLGLNKESALQVYQASDTVSWKLISTVANMTRDTVNNTITITNAPLYGNYALASSAPSRVEQIESAIPSAFNLQQNYPNPFNPSTSIRFALPHEAQTTLIIYDVLGREVRTLVSGTMNAGYYQAVWDGRNNAGVQTATGMYVYRIQSGSFMDVKKMMATK
ncbi:MAG: T9SS type A sorting domain-containing protein, partial [Ignavibacteriales bacterium]|nr:T9SS type A sorting domain-containing protein [Ignavibacteriales bacterium]